MNELNIIEASNMPYNTEFKVKIDCYYKYDDACRIRDNTKLIAVNTQGGVKFKEYSDVEKASKTLINAKFIPIQQLVSFMEVVNSNKKCRVEHKYVEEIRAVTDLQDFYINEFRNNDCIPLNYLMHILCYHTSQEDLKEIIKEGKWYLEW